MSLQQSIDRRVTEASERFRTGQVSAVVGNKVTVITSGGGSLTISRLATWTPAVSDIVVIAMTPMGWVALGKVA